MLVSGVIASLTMFDIIIELVLLNIVGLGCDHMVIGKVRWFEQRIGFESDGLIHKYQNDYYRCDLSKLLI